MMDIALERTRLVLDLTMTKLAMRDTDSGQHTQMVRAGCWP